MTYAALRHFVGDIGFYFVVVDFRTTEVDVVVVFSRED